MMDPTLFCRLLGRTLLLTGCVLFQGCGKPQPPSPRLLETSFWVWNRSAPLEAGERASLVEAGVSRIWWQIGEIEWLEGNVVAKAKWPLPADTPELRHTPVLRLEPTIKDPAKVDARQLAAWAKDAGVTDEIQFDYDCPNRLLGRYGELLRAFRKAFGTIRISTTALGAWCDAEEWPELEKAVDSVHPMLYDILPEREQPGSRPAMARPLVEAAAIGELVRKWDVVTTIPWQVGLPNFTRLSLFHEGKPGGHLRDWAMEELARNPSIRYDGAGDPGVGLFEVMAPTRIGGVDLSSGDWLCLRTCDRAQLRSVLKAVGESSATGVVWFQMPRPCLASNGWSLAQIRHRFEGSPRLAVTMKNQRITVTNTGNADISPLDYESRSITLSWPQTILREFIPGDFHSADFLRNGQPVPVMAATGITLAFPPLAAGESASSGLALFRFPENSLEIKWQTHDSSGTVTIGEP